MAKNNFHPFLGLFSLDHGMPKKWNVNSAFAFLDNDRFKNSSYGLAFPTSQNNDLKLLVFGRFNREQLRAQVYTLRTNSQSWVELPVEPLDGSVGPISWIVPSPCLFHNGALHFRATASQVYEFILCFDVDNEQFREIKLPHNYSNGLSLKFKNSDPDRSLNHKKERFKVFEVESRSNQGQTIMTS